MHLFCLHSKPNVRGSHQNTLFHGRKRSYLMGYPVRLTKIKENKQLVWFVLCYAYGKFQSIR